MTPPFLQGFRRLGKGRKGGRLAHHPRLVCRKACNRKWVHQRSGDRHAVLRHQLLQLERQPASQQHDCFGGGSPTRRSCRLVHLNLLLANGVGDPMPRLPCAG